MAVDHIRYDILAQEALRGVVRTVLEDAATHGLPGDHHFYITFNTRAEGVQISPRMLAQYPAEMTIVLQHQFWDLIVTPERFEVGLSFGGIPERLNVPYSAIKGFFDPSVQFGLQFEPAPESAEAADAPQGAAETGAPGEGAVRPPAEHKHGAPAITMVPTPANPPANAPTGPAANQAPAPAPSGSDPGPDKPAGGAEVVRLDRFRKK